MAKPFVGLNILLTFIQIRTEGEKLCLFIMYIILEHRKGFHFLFLPRVRVRIAWMGVSMCAFGASAWVMGVAQKFDWS